ncbi:hypothetical protein ACFL6Y_11610, partial [Elusimicrobiota bacterium]
NGAVFAVETGSPKVDMSSFSKDGAKAADAAVKPAKIGAEIGENTDDEKGSGLGWLLSAALAVGGIALLASFVPSAAFMGPLGIVAVLGIAYALGRLEF